MIGLDTNVVVRYIMQDDMAQAALASALIEGLSDDQPGFISVVTCVEIVWVLTRSYRLPRDAIIETLEILLSAYQLRFEHKPDLYRALGDYKSGKADFADALIHRLNLSAGCDKTVTFDVAAADHAGMTLITAA
ncbi:PIN domain-containing protein [Asticcacaulis sp.]|uniref:PIN domain-containing protein n=1 Tax=Asticcacaulis sp. TaxID=1872648 RepID=UPI00263063EC|nr:type II toxin-antitoxin system VapC family toxin [Asticcacaulis sp.]